MANDSLERRFDEAMHDLYERIVRECGKRYHPTKFFEMLKTLGGVTTAHRLLEPNSDFFSYGFEKLLKLDLLELTMEKMILSLDYKDQLFQPSELQRAQERLDVAEAMRKTRA